MHSQDNMDWFFRAFNATRIYEIFLKSALAWHSVATCHCLDFEGFLVGSMFFVGHQKDIKITNFRVFVTCLASICVVQSCDLRTPETPCHRGSPRFYGFIVWSSIIGGFEAEVVAEHLDSTTHRTGNQRGPKGQPNQ